MSRYSMIPPSFVTLRHLKELKEKREEEEKLKKEEEERLRKLRDEEEERKRLRELEEEEGRFRKLKEGEETRKHPPAKTLGSNGTYYRRKRREGGSKRGVNPDARPLRGGANIEAQVVVSGGSGDPLSSSGANVEVEVALGTGRSVVEAPTIEELGKKKKKGKSKNWRKQKEKMAEMPLAFNGSDEGRKGFGASADADIFEEEKKSTDVTLNGNGLDKMVTVKFIASGAGQMVTDIQKRVSDLKIGGRNRNPSRGRRPYRGARSGQGGGGVMMWVKKTMPEA